MPEQLLQDASRDPLADDADPRTRAERVASRTARRSAVREARRAARKQKMLDARRWTSRSARLARLALVAAVLASILGVVVSQVQLRAATASNARVLSALSMSLAQRPPYGFASDCVAAFIESGADGGAVYRSLCQPGASTSTYAASAATMTASRVTSYDATADPTDPSHYSVRVAVWVNELSRKEDGSSAWTSDGVYYFRAEVSINLESLTYNLIGNPYPVAAPSRADWFRPVVTPGPVDMSDPRTAMLSGFVAAQFVGRPTGNFFTPGATPIPLVPAGRLNSAELVGVGYSDGLVAPSMDATVWVRVTYPQGTSLVSSLSLRLSVNQNTWTIDHANRLQPIEKG